MHQIDLKCFQKQKVLNLKVEARFSEEKSFTERNQKKNKQHVNRSQTNKRLENFFLL